MTRKDLHFQVSKFCDQHPVGIEKYSHFQPNSCLYLSLGCALRDLPNSTGVVSRITFTTMKNVLVTYDNSSVMRQLAP